LGAASSAGVAAEAGVSLPLLAVTTDAAGVKLHDPRFTLLLPLWLLLSESCRREGLHMLLLDSTADSGPAAAGNPSRLRLADWSMSRLI
jgi:hypothetical protein